MSAQTKVRRRHRAAQAMPIEIYESQPPRVRRWQIHDFATGKHLAEPAPTEDAAWTAAAATLPADGSPDPPVAEVERLDRRSLGA